MAEIVSTGSSTIRRLTRLIALDEGVYAATISEDATFGLEAPNILRLNGGASNRTITALAALEADGECRGPYLWHNSGTTNNLVFASSAAVTITTLTPGEWAIAYWSGTAWAASELTAAAAAALLAAANVWTGTNDFGVDDTGVDVRFFGATAARYLIWDESADLLRAQDNVKIGWGSGAGTTPDVSVLWDASKLVVSQLTANSAVEWGVDGAGFDQVWYMDTAGAKITLDQSADSLIFAGAARIQYPVVTGSTGQTVSSTGTTITEGMERRIYEATVAPAAVETALITLPANSVVRCCQSTVKTALTGGGTTVTHSIGITGDVDAYGTASSGGSQADLLTQNAKIDAIGTKTNAGAGIGVFNASTVAVKLIAAATGGATAGDTALTAGTVRVRIVYDVALSLDN